MKQIEVCLTPELINQHDLVDKVVVVVDIFRATSCIVTGMAHGIEAIIPTDNIEECISLGKKGMITAGERGGKKIEGFDIGNSPFEYMRPEYREKQVSVTTTNGTRAIMASVQADQILIGAFLNLGALATYLSDKEQSILIHCAGWKGMVNIEDTLFAGALIDELKDLYTPVGDPALLASQLYEYNKGDLKKIAKNSSHAHRLARFGVEKDLEFCMQPNVYPVVPVYKNKKIELASSILSGF